VSLATITTYQAYLSIHILAAVLWVGGAFMIQVFATRASRARDAQRLATFASEAEWVGTRVFVPASLTLVVFGFLMIQEGDLDYQFWLVFPIVVWIASFVSGAAFLGPQSGRLSKAIAQHGMDSPEAMSRLQRIFVVSRIELVLLVLVVLDMALKPGA
jgi:uncharacterized membrane protein